MVIWSLSIRSHTYVTIWCKHACIALHRTALKCNELHCPVLHCIALHCSAVHYTAVHYTAVHYTAVHYTAVQYSKTQYNNVCIHVHTVHACACAHMRVHTCTHMCICVHTCAYMCIHVRPMFPFSSNRIRFLLHIGPCERRPTKRSKEKNNGKFAKSESLQDFTREKSAEMICLDVKDNANKTRE